MSGAENILHIIGANIRQLREGKGWESSRLADALGYSVSKVSDMERAARGIDIGVAELFRVAAVLGISDPTRMLKRMPGPGAFSPFKGRGRQGGGGKKPEAVVELLREEPKRIPVDHSICVPINPDSMCKECREMFGAAKAATR